MGYITDIWSKYSLDLSRSSWLRLSESMYPKSSLRCWYRNGFGSEHWKVQSGVKFHPFSKFRASFVLLVSLFPFAIQICQFFRISNKFGGSMAISHVLWWDLPVPWETPRATRNRVWQNFGANIDGRNKQVQKTCLHLSGRCCSSGDWRKKETCPHHLLNFRRYEVESTDFRQRWEPIRIVRIRQMRGMHTGIDNGSETFNRKWNKKSIARYGITHVDGGTAVEFVCCRRRGFTSTERFENWNQSFKRLPSMWWR